MDKGLELIETLCEENETIYSMAAPGGPLIFYFLMDKDSTDAGGAIEDTLHRLIEFGCSDEEIYMALGARKKNHYDESDIYIDLGYALPEIYLGSNKEEYSDIKKEIYYVEHYLDPRNSLVVHAVSPEMAIRLAEYSSGTKGGWDVEPFNKRGLLFTGIGSEI